jgi:Zn-finger nucleic acid-binding protein
MFCPTCNRQLLETKVEGVTIYECWFCKIFWFDAGDLDAHVKAIVSEETNLPLLASIFKSSDCSDEKFCPRCVNQKLICGSVGTLRLSKCKKCSGMLIAKEQLELLASNPWTDPLTLNPIIWAILNIFRNS